tara:strand:+ start:1466 stop:2596 length:1131 start_codon:yes stop_codon:yes gene_type:complete
MIHLYNLPTSYTLADYKEATDNIAKKFFSKNCLAIYTWGNIGAPGISDLDFLMVMQPNTKKIKRIALNKQESYLSYHPFFIVDEHIIENMKLIYPNAPLKLVKGNKITINKISKETKDAINTILYIDICIRHYPRDFLERILRNRIDTRNALLRLNSLAQSFLNWKPIRPTKEQKDFAKRITNLRKNWFSIDDKKRKQQVISLTEEAIPLSLQIVEALQKHLQKTEFIKVTKIDKPVVYTGLRHRTYFVENWTPKQALSDTKTFYKAYGKFYSYLPIEFAALYSEYSKQEGILSNHIDNNLEQIGFRYKIQNKEIIAERINLLNHQANIAKTTKHSHFPAFYDFGYKSTFGLINKSIHVVRKIKDTKIYKKLTKKN